MTPSTPSAIRGSLHVLYLSAPDGDPAPADEIAVIVRDLAVLRDELKSAGAWVFAGGLEQPGTARVIHPVVREQR